MWVQIVIWVKPANLSSVYSNGNPGPEYIFLFRRLQDFGRQRAIPKKCLILIKVCFYLFWTYNTSRDFFPPLCIHSKEMKNQKSVDAYIS